VLVVGAGVSGLLHVLLARSMGADRVLLANRRADRMRVAVERGVLPDGDCLLLDENLRESIADATGAVDAVVVAVSGGRGPSIVEGLWPALADGGTVHLYGGFPAGSTVRLPGGDEVATHPIRQGGRHSVPLPGGRTATVVGSRGAGAGDFEAARELCVNGGGLPLASLISHVTSLDAAPAVLDELTSSGRVNGDPVLRVVVDLRLPGRVVRPVNGVGLPSVGAPP
jgi:threonine dehydrogenase-like Zn-dependent dehydrogenase